jgi:hypothetical protein
MTYCAMPSRPLLIAPVGILGLLFAFGEAAARAPIPPDSAQQEALALIKEVYGEEYANAKTDEQKSALAKKLLGKANESQDTTNRYVLLCVARDVATNGGDGLTAFQAIDEMGGLYQVDAVRMKAVVLSSLSKKARLPADHKSIAEQALSLVEQAVGRDDFGLTGNLIDLALDEARKAREGELVKKIASRKKEVDEITEAYKQLKEALAVLETSPTEPGANLVVGKYRCFVKGDWETGLPMLALGSDAALKALAWQEMEKVPGHAEQVQLGDGWWELAEKEDGLAKRRLQERAAYWYRKALPELTGLVKDRVKKRIGSMQEIYLADLKPVRLRRADNGPLAGPRILAHPVPTQAGDKAASHIVFEIERKYRQLSGRVGIAHNKIPKTPLTFRIVGDGRLLWQSSALKGGREESFDIPVGGISVLELLVDCPGHAWWANAVWIDPVLSK